MQRPGKYDQDIESFINEFWHENCFPPSVRDIESACHVSGPSATYYVLRKLERQRKLRIHRGRVIPEWVIKRLSPIS
jgi:hypothetical protein